MLKSEKVTLLHGCFSRFLNCTNGTKSRKASQLLFRLCLQFEYKKKSRVLQSIKKSGPETWDPETRDLGPRTLRPGSMRPGTLGP